jgi:PAS domain S-box-containing protein
MIGRRDDEILPAPEAADLIALKRSTITRGHAAAADVVLSLRGAERFYEIRVDLLRDGAGQVEGLTMAAIDVTQRRKSDRAAILAAERAKILALATKEGVVLHDGEVVFEVNDAFCRLFGYARDEIIGASPMIFVAPESRDLVVSQAAALARGPFEILALRRNGTTFPIEVEVERFEYEDRLFRVAHLRDLTAQKEAESALRESEERYRALAAATREGVIIHDGKRIVEVNDYFCALHRVTREEAVGRPAFSFIAPSALERSRALIALGSPEPYESLAIRGDGTTFPVESAGRPIFYQGRLMRVATLRDLTERHTAEVALRESEERLRGFADASSDILWVVDAATKLIEFLSPSYEEIYGESRERILEDRARWAELLHPDDRDRAVAAREATLAGERVELEYRIVRPDGAVRWIRDVGFPVRGVDGSVRRAAGLARDVTLRKEIESRQRLMLGELNHRVKNTLATVQSIARQTLRHSPSPAAFQEQFEDRLLALSQTHNLLTHENWERGSLTALLKQELMPHGRERIHLHGEQDIHLAPRAVVPLGMVLHELATNAAKYGALSVPGGHLTVAWEMTGTLFQTLKIEWRERGGPRIEAPPVRRGFGSRLLERGITAELEGKVSLAFPPEGLEASIEIPLDPPNLPKL